jgi:cytidine deaminase
MDDKELIKKAKSVLRPKRTRHGSTVGAVGCALLTYKGNVHTGVCIETCSGMGLCAEQSAIAAMVVTGEYKIKRIVAVSESGVIAPCGKCREFIHQIHEDNLDTEVIIAENKAVKLRELLPYPWDG